MLVVVILATKLCEFDEDSQKIMQRWFTINSLSESTRITYISYISQFIKQCEKPLSYIYEVAQKEQLENVPMNQRKLTNWVLDYKYYLDQSDYAQNTKNLNMNTIYSFCKAFDFKLPKIRRKKVLCEDKNYERPIKKQEIISMLNTNSLREKAFLVLQATSGMGSKEARTLTIHNIITVVNLECGTDYHNVNDLLENKNEILSHKCFEIRIVRKKVNYRHITFISNECMKHLLNYLKYRSIQEGSKKLKGYADEPLFITNKGGAMDSKAVTGMYREMGKRVGFISESNTYRFWRSHNIRKYFYNIVEEIVGIEYADEWLGHIPSSVTRAYARREFRMKQAYLKCIPYLTLEEDNSGVERKIFELEEEIRRLKTKYE